jgi:hypothetical protein
MSTIAVVFAVGGGVAYAANTVFSSDIVNGEVKTPDLATNAVTSPKVQSCTDAGLMLNYRNQSSFTQLIGGGGVGEATYDVYTEHQDSGQDQISDECLATGSVTSVFSG